MATNDGAATAVDAILNAKGSILDDRNTRLSVYLAILMIFVLPQLMLWSWMSDESDDWCEENDYCGLFVFSHTYSFVVVLVHMILLWFMPCLSSLANNKIVSVIFGIAYIIGGVFLMAAMGSFVDEAVCDWDSDTIDNPYDEYCCGCSIWGFFTFYMGLHFILGIDCLSVLCGDLFSSKSAYRTCSWCVCYFLACAMIAEPATNDDAPYPAALEYYDDDPFDIYDEEYNASMFEAFVSGTMLLLLTCIFVFLFSLIKMILGVKLVPFKMVFDLFEIILGFVLVLSALLMTTEMAGLYIPFGIFNYGGIFGVLILPVLTAYDLQYL